MKYLTTLRTGIEVLYTPPFQGDDKTLDVPTLWVEPDWESVTKQLVGQNGIRSIAVTVKGKPNLDPYREGESYEVTLVAHAREFAGDAWDDIRGDLKTEREAVTSAAILDIFLMDGDGLGGLIETLFTQRLLNNYQVTGDTSHFIEEAA